MAGVKPFHNGDGVCFLMSRDVCKVSASTGWMVTNSIRQGKCLVSNPVPDFIVTSTRSLNVFLPANPPNVNRCLLGVVRYFFGFSLTAADEDDNRVTLSFPYPKELARTPQVDNLRSQLAKLGNTPFEVAGHLSEEASGIRLNLSETGFFLLPWWQTGVGR